MMMFLLVLGLSGNQEENVPVKVTALMKLTILGYKGINKQSRLSQIVDRIMQDV